MKIEIILDHTKKLQEKGFEIYNSDIPEKDYFNAYTNLQNAIKQNSNKNIIVYRPALKTWLVKGLSKYKKVEIIEKEITFQDLLSAKWKIDYDISITTNDIINNDLLSIPIQGVERKTFTDFICENFISIHLNTIEFNKFKFGELLNDLIKFQLKKKTLPSIFSTIYEYKINKLKDNNEDYKYILNYLIEDFFKVYKSSCYYKLIMKYPINFQEKCMPGNWINMCRNLRLNFNKLDISYLKETSDLINELNIFYKNIERTNLEFTKELVEQLIDYSSGELKEEIEYILNILKSNPSLINKKIINKIKSLFNPLIIHLYNHKLEALKNYEAPLKPKMFNQNENLNTVINWAIDNYLPYRFWLENTHKIDEDVLECGANFSDYIMDNYDKVSYHYNNSVYRFIFNYKNQILKTQVPIFLIIDNFNYKFLDLLISSFRKYKIIPKKIEPYLSLLPTETSITKSSIISGKRDKADNNYSEYRRNLIEKWKEYFPNHKIKYISKPGELDDYKVKKNEFIVINYLEIDNELHQSYERTAIEHIERVGFNIEHLTKLISNFIRRNSIENRSRIFFISDHGSTLINKNINNKLDMDNCIKDIKEQTIDFNHRFITINDNEFQKLRNNNNISGELFFLDKETSGDGINYIIAKGYNRFKEINADFYVHGGALPEEIIIPAGFFEYDDRNMKNIILQLVKSEYRLMAKEFVIIRLANPNNAIMENIYIQILANNLLISKIFLNKIIDKSEKEIQEDIRLSNRNIKSFKIYISYEISGQIYKQTFEYPIKIKTITQQKFDLSEF